MVCNLNQLDASQTNYIKSDSTQPVTKFKYTSHNPTHDIFKKDIRKHKQIQLHLIKILLPQFILRLYIINNLT